MIQLRMKLIYASDIHSYKHCKRRFWLEHNPPTGYLELEEDPFLQLRQQMGQEHEQAILTQLARGRRVVEPQSVEETLELMNAGIELIYQGQLLDEQRGLYGKPDFLIRGEGGRYSAGDAKLARKVKAKIGIQMAFYRALLGGVENAYVFLGNGLIETIDKSYDRELSKFLEQARELIEMPSMPSESYSISKCSQCVFHEYCKAQFKETEDISLLYGIHGGSVEGLHSYGIKTIQDLARSSEISMPDLPYLKGRERKFRAITQARAHLSGETYIVRDIDLPRGTYIHFDVESNPLTAEGVDHVYLWGFLIPGYTRNDYEYIWSDSLDDDEQAFLTYLDLIESFLNRWPDLKLVHFSPYERAQVRSYIRRYSLSYHPVARWLMEAKDSPFIDFKKIVMESLVLPLERYGLKDICKHPNLVNFQWENENSGSQWSIIEFLKFQTMSPSPERDAIKHEILTYNRDDVRATRELELWLRKLKKA